MDANLTSRLFEGIGCVPGGTSLSRLLLAGQYALWRRYPSLTSKVSNFWVVGAICFVLQLSVTYGLQLAGLTAWLSLVVGIEISVFANYCLNRRITWRNVFVQKPDQPLLMMLVWFWLLFAIFNLFSLTVAVKMVGIPFLHHVLGWPIWVLVMGFELSCAAINFLGADKVTFGLMVRVANRG